jgi:SAM-dependent methyltransferase
VTSDIKFNNGATYERYMGHWSQLVGHQFLDWLGAAPGLRWLDVGCGNGAFTESLVARAQPASVHGIDPSAEQLTFARGRPALSGVDFRQGDAMALPYEADAFDVALMPLVIHFVSDPARGVSEMARVVRAEGTVAAYVWDMDNGGFPYTTLQREMRECAMFVPSAPRDDASSLAALELLWKGAGLQQVECRSITVSRTFASFEDYWTTVCGGPSVGRTLEQLPPERTARLQERMRVLLPTDAAGRITYSATANAVRGVVPVG